MPAILRCDFKRLMEDIESVEKDMETLKRDYSAWTRDIQNIYHTRRLVNQRQERRKNFHWRTENDGKGR